MVVTGWSGRRRLCVNGLDLKKRGVRVTTGPTEADPLSSCGIFEHLAALRHSAPPPFTHSLLPERCHFSGKEYLRYGLASPADSALRRGLSLRPLRNMKSSVVTSLPAGFSANALVSVARAGVVTPPP